MSSNLSQFFQGTPAQYKQTPNFAPEQKPLYNSVINAGQNPGAGGAFGESADYFRSLLSDNNSTLQAMIAPEQRRFQQQTIPGLFQQFAGLGAGAQNSSGFENSVTQAGTDLAERIASIRANLRMQGAQGLQGIGQFGLGNFHTNTFEPRAPGLLETLAPIVGQIAAAGLAGSTGGASWAIPLLLKWLQGKYDPEAEESGKSGIQDKISNDPPTGPSGQGSYYNPYTGVQ